MERRFLDYLYRTHRRLPDDVRRYIREIPCEADFFYEPNICVFCDGAVHDLPEQRAKRWGDPRPVGREGLSHHHSIHLGHRAI